MCRQSPPSLSHLISLHLLVSWLTITRFLAAKSLPMVCAISQQESKVLGDGPNNLIDPNSNNDLKVGDEGCGCRWRALEHEAARSAARSAARTGEIGGEDWKVRRRDRDRQGGADRGEIEIKIGRDRDRDRRDRDRQGRFLGLI
ncbi:hypothetical protein CMV_020000 [Castanea mollissima]|uniref:Uncharacterized protein n=1 Tax=Castanea mollissima TaxID=60419 RepID=A0A8J4VE16_9ROSI|nr:hypothetical protein CMV_020000 [Castanea mollissima]